MEPNSKNITTLEVPVPTPVDSTHKNDAQVPPVTVGSIRTMQNDAEGAVRSKNESLVTIALEEERKRIAEQQAHDKNKALEEPRVSGPAPRPLNRIVIVAVLIFIILALVLSYRLLAPKLLLLTQSANKPLVLDSTSTKNNLFVTISPSLIPATSEKHISIDEKSFQDTLASIAKERTVSLTQGSIENIYLTENITTETGSLKASAVSANKFFSLITTTAPDILMRSLEDQFMVGFLGEANNTVTPFIILKISSYDTGIAGMLAWEDTLPDFFDILFGTKINATIINNSSFHNTLTPGSTTRFIGETDGLKIVYTFVNSSIIIITTSENALEKITSMTRNPEALLNLTK